MNQDLHDLDFRLYPLSRTDRAWAATSLRGVGGCGTLLFATNLSFWKRRGPFSLLAAADRDGPPGADTSFCPGGTRPAQKKGYRILIIEDDFASLELYSCLLKSFGYTILLAGNGEQGLALARRTRPDLILCDVKLPKMSGVEVVRQLKSEPTLAQIPIVAVTAYAMFGDRERLLAAGFDDYLPKPIEAESFVDHVRDIIAAKGGGRLN